MKKSKNIIPRPKSNLRSYYEALNALFIHDLQEPYWTGRLHNENDVSRGIRTTTKPDSYYNPELEEDNSSALESFKNNLRSISIGQVLGGPIGAIGTALAIGGEDIGHSLRMTGEKIAQSFVDNDKEKLRQLEQQKRDIEMVDEYKNLVGQYKQLSNQVVQLKNAGADIITISQAQELADDVKAKLDLYDDYFKGEGSKSAIIADLMYDPNKLDGVSNRYHVLNRYLTKDNAEMDGGWFGNTLTFLGNTLSTAGNEFWALWDKMFAKEGYVTKRAIQAMQDRPEDIAVKNQLYKTYDEVLNQNDEQYQYLRNKNGRDIEQTRLELKADENFRRTGKMTSFGYPTWKDGTLQWEGVDLFDPEDVPAEFRKEQELHSGEWYHPLYTLPEVGSSISMLEGMGETLAVDAGARYLIRQLPVWASKVLPMGKWAKAVRTANLVRDVNAANKYSKYIKATEAGVGATQKAILSSDAAASLYFTRRMREMETNLEAIQALGGRILNTASNNQNIDIRQIDGELRKLIEDLGLSTDGQTTDEVITTAAAFNLRTSNPEFNDIMKNSEKGLNKLINANNALAYSDYLEILPFMHFGGKVFKSFGAGGRKVFLNNPIGRAIEPKVQALYDSTIGAAASKFLNHDAVDTALKLRHAGQFAWKTGKTVGRTMAIEGVEEGVQHLLQKRYERGEYDDYNSNVSPFSMAEVFRDLGVSKDAVLGYWGLNSGDPDNDSAELRKAMNIGALVGGLFPVVGITGRNIVPGEQADIRNFANQLKSDDFMKRVVGENYGMAEDEAKLGMFYDALDSGIKPGSLFRSIKDFKEHTRKGSLVDPEFIDEDLRLALAANTVYSNERLNEMFADKPKEFKRKLVQKGARAIVDYAKTREIIDEDSEAIASHDLKRSIDIRTLLNEQAPVQEKQRVLNESPELRLVADIVKNAYNDYISTNKKSSSGKNLAYTQNLKKNNKQSFFKDEYIQEYIDENPIEDVPKYKQKEYYFLNDELKALAIKYASEQYKALLNSGVQSIELFADTLLESYNHFLNLDILNSLSQDLQDQQYLLDFAKNELGIDVDLSRILGMIDGLSDLVKIRQTLLNKNSDWILNNIKGKYSKLSEILADIDNVSDASDIRHLTERFLVNNAISKQQGVLSAMYTNGEVSPADIIGSYSPVEDQNKFYNDVREYADLLEGVISNSILNEEITEDDIKAVYEAKKDTAKRVIEDDVNDSLERMKIAHREFMRDRGVDEPTIQRVEDGDPDAIEAVSSAMEDNLEENEEPSPAEDVDTGEGNAESVVTNNPPTRQRSDSEKRLRKFIYGDEVTPEDVIRELKEKEEAEYLDLEDVNEDSVTVTYNVTDFGTVESLKDFAEDRMKHINWLEFIKNVGDSDVIVKYLDSTNKFDSIYIVAYVTESNGNRKIEIKTYLDKNINGTMKLVPAEFQLSFGIPDRLLLIQGESQNDVYSISYPTAEGSIEQYIINDASIYSREGQLPQTGTDNNTTHQPVEEDQAALDEEDIQDNELEINIDEEPDIAQGIDNVENDEIGESISDVEDNGQSIEDSVDSDQSVDNFEFNEDGFSVLGLDYIEEVNDEENIYDDPNLFDPNLAGKNSDQLTKQKDKVQIERNYTWLTFFYQPDAAEVMDLKIAGKRVKFKDGYKLRPGSELSKKLSTNGWISDKNVDIFYMVTSPLGEESTNTDDLTVLMVFEDSNDKTVYAAALRRPELARTKLLFLGVDQDLYKEYEEESIYYRYSQIKRKPKEKDYDNYDKFIGAENKWKKQARKWYYQLPLDNEVKRNIMQSSRKLARLKNSSIIPLTNKQIQTEVEKLINNRNSIIKKCCTKFGDSYFVDPTLATRDLRVRPANIVFSNGIFNKTDEYHKLTEGENQFGLSDNVEQILESIDKGKVLFGVGGGLNSDPINAVMDINDRSVIYNGRGAAGKIFAIVKGLRKQLDSLMLWETRFDKQLHKDANGTSVGRTILEPVGVKDGNLILAFNVDGTINEEASALPSAAEVILYLITNRISSKLFPNENGSATIREELSNLIIHRNILGKYDSNRNKEIFKNKQIDFAQDEKTGEYFLFISLYEDGRLVDRKYSLSDLFSDTPESENIRKKVIYHIAKHMHWNTDLTDMPINDPFTVNYASFVESLQNYFKLNPKEKEFKFCGLDEFTFSKEDFLNPHKVSPLAWLIKTGKLRTNVSVQQIFAAPFIYSNEIEQSPAEEIIQDGSGGSNAPVVSVIDNLINTEERLNQVKERFRNANLVVVDQAKKKELLDQYESDETKKHGGLKDILALNVPKKRKKSRTDVVKQEVEQRVRKALDDYAKSQGLELAEITLPQRIEEIDLKNNLPIAVVNNDGTVNVFFKNVDQLRSIREGFVTGVFSTEKKSGTADIEKTKEFLIKKLGLKDDEIKIADAVMRSVSGEDVYGVTSVSVDTVQDLYKAGIEIDPQGGKTIGFHEAWHYINLLLHNEDTRNELYRLYKKEHPEYKKYSDEKIEELMADDFAKYSMNMYMGTLRGKIKKSFDKLSKFINIYKKQSVIEEVYNAVQRGEYSALHIDKKSAKQFKKKYEDYAFGSRFYWPGVRASDIIRVKTIKTAAEFKSVAESMAFALMRKYQLNTENKIKAVDSTMFRDFLKDMLREAEIEGDIYKKGIILDVINNGRLFSSVISEVFQRYGIIPHFNFNKPTTLKENDNVDKLADMESIEGNDDVEFIYDLDYMEVPRKANVRFAAKLFMSLIPSGKWIADENGNIKFEEEKDSKLGLPVYLPQNYVWYKLLNALWNCSSYNDKVLIPDETQPTGFREEYDANSIVGTVKRLKNIDTLFYALDQRLSELDDIEDVQIQTSIFNAIVSQKPEILITLIKDKYIKPDEYADEATYTNTKQRDTKREFTILPDNALNEVNSLKRLWSKLAATSGLVDYVSTGDDEKRRVVQKFSRTYYDMLENGSNESDERIHGRVGIIKAIDELKKSSKKNFEDIDEDELQERLADIEREFIWLANAMGIAMDSTSLNIYLNSHIESDQPTTIDRFNALYTVTRANKTGGVIYILEAIKKNINKNSIGKIRFRAFSQDIDKMYTAFGKKSEMNRIASAWAQAHPAPSEHSITLPDGKRAYPITENNAASDIVRKFSQDRIAIEGHMKSPYARHSFVLKRLLSGGKLKLGQFKGMKDADNLTGKSYLEISDMEDYISKIRMTLDGYFISPTMADKKPLLSLKHVFDDAGASAATTIHDLITYDTLSENGIINQRRFSLDTLNIFLGYFIDELESLEQYYSKENVKYISENPKKLIKNYHGKVVNGKLQFGGNGGMFRYFYDIIPLVDDNGNHINWNQFLQFQYNIEKHMIDNPSEYGGRGKLRSEGVDIEDGFGRIRQTLAKIREDYLQTQEGQNKLKELINYKLMKLVDKELDTLSKSLTKKLVYKDKNSENRYISIGIPADILKVYTNMFSKAGVSYSYNMYAPGNTDELANLTLTTIANHVASYLISLIEFEKIFSGDPAYYKWQSSGSQKVKFGDREESVSIVTDKHSDKIKRLGALLSPGQNLRLNFSDEYYEFYGVRKGSKYTNMNMRDFTGHITDELKSEMELKFKKQLFINRMISGKYSDIFKPSDVFELVNKIYKDDDLFLDLYDKISQKERAEIEKLSELSVNPYYKNKRGDNNINVSDAQAMMRPAFYRKIKMSLGDWQYDETEITYLDENGEVRKAIYSDDIAYDLLEKDAEWMYSAEKTAIVSKFEALPLKMTFFTNNSQSVYGTESKDVYQNVPIYNKMAIFPLFKYSAGSKTGTQLYERMNKEGEEIDQIIFESGVKVGLTLELYDPYDGLQDIYSLNDLDKPSSLSINDLGEISSSEQDGALNITIQDMSDLRLQLNTESHEATERDMGSQTSKLIYSNIFDDVLYDEIEDQPTKSGKQIKKQILSIYSALASINGKQLAAKYKSPNAVKSLFGRIVKLNNIMRAAIDLLNNGGKAASLLSRVLFQHAISSMINNEVIDIETQGGTAVQQSIFGFVGTNSNVSDATRIYRAYNNGDELKWNTENNSMEVLLSMNFLRPIIPSEYAKDFNTARQWLIDNDIINGVKSEKYWGYSEKDQALMNKLSVRIEDLQFTPVVSKILELMGIDTVSDILNNRARIENHKNEKVRTEVGEMLNALDISYDTKIPESEKVVSKPKPFGIGYRIPTLGQSSIFSFTVADVLPSTAGDLIVVPKEFTAQTGSDFDVDKLYLSTYYYKDGKRTSSTTEQDGIFDDSDSIETSFDNGDLTKEQIINKLISLYSLILQSNALFSNTKASIDTLTNLVKDNIVPYAREGYEGYVEGMEENLPSFLSDRKSEFTSGKSGVAVVALNITNLALTLATGLSMEITDIPFNFTGLDSIIGNDGRFNSDWLSMALNLHVDVAKDPIIFPLNINAETLDTLCFLLRNGMGAGAFAFLCQPSIKDFANRVVNSNTMYGNNLFGKDSYKNKHLIKNDTFKNLFEYYKGQLSEALNDQPKDIVAKYQEASSYITSEKIDLKAAAEVAEITDAFDSEMLIRMLKNKDSVESKFFQLYALAVYKQLGRYVDAMAGLVLTSRIDTKKHGKTMALRMDFINSYYNFIYGNSSIKWRMQGVEVKKSKKNKKNADDAEQKEKPINVLHEYFKRTSLESKLNISTELMRHIGESQLITSIPSYEETFLNVMRNINGQKSLDTEDGTLVVYNPIFDPKLIDKLGQTIDDVLRFISLSVYGEPVESTDDIRPIDFSPKDQIAAQDKMFELLFGSENAESIFERTARIINKIKYEGIAPDLVNDMGDISNKFLNYIRPQLPTTKTGIGKFILPTSSYDNADLEKSTLMAEWDALLRHNNAEIRQLARDVAFFSYYIGYDTNSRESLFELVPPYFRSQYDEAVSKFINASDRERISAEYMIDTIFRNFWDNDTIVRKYYLTTKKSKQHKSLKDFSKSGEMAVNTHNFGSGLVAGGILTTRATLPYIKIERRDKTFLYKKIGYITNIAEDLKKKEYNDIFVYVLVPKAGYRGSGQSLYEFNVSDTVKSMFEENDMPEAFSVENTLKEIQTLLSENPEFKFIKESVLDVATYYIKEQSPQLNDKYTENGIVRIHTPKRLDIFETTIKRDPFTVTLNFGESEESGKNIVNVGSKDSAQTVVDNIIAQFGDQDVSNLAITVYAIGDIPNIKISKSEIEKYVADQKAQWIARNSMYALVSLTMEEEQYENMLKQIAERELQVTKKKQFMSDILNALNLNTTIRSLYTSSVVDENISDSLEAIIKAGLEFEQNFTGRDQVVVPTDLEFFKGREDNDYFSVIDQITLDSGIIASQEEQGAQEGVYEIQDNVAEIVQEDMEEDANVASNLGISSLLSKAAEGQDDVIDKYILPQGDTHDETAKINCD